MPSFSLSQLRSAVRTLGDYDNSAVMTDAFVDDSINKALAELFELVTDAFEGYYTTTGTVTTADGEETVALPADFYDLRALDRDLGDNAFEPLERITLAQSYRYAGSSIPRAYMLHGGTAPGTIRLWPIPNDAYDLRITYDPLFSPLVDDEDTFDFRNGWEEYVIQAALLRLDQREERPLGDRMQVIERSKARIVAAAKKRDSAGPEYLTLPNGAGPYRGDW